MYIDMHRSNVLKFDFIPDPQDRRPLCPLPPLDGTLCQDIEKKVQQLGLDCKNEQEEDLLEAYFRV